MIESVEHGKTKVMVGHYQVRRGDTKSQLDTICPQGKDFFGSYGKTFSFSFLLVINQNIIFFFLSVYVLGSEIK